MERERLNHDSLATSLNWAKQDIEQRLWFPGARYTRVNTLLAMLLGALTSVAFYALVIPFPNSTIHGMFTQQGPIPYSIVLLSSWSLAILILKWRKLKFQRRALMLKIIPPDAAFVLSAANVDIVIDRIYQIVDHPKYFILFHRIVVALANLKNLGRVSDVDEILRTQADNDEASIDNSYSLVGGFVWAIPVLGFIGTVLGLSAAIGEFGNVLQASDDLTQIKEGLRLVTGGLSMAFVTTLQALVAALVIQLLLTFLRKSELEFLEECAEYCTAHIVNRLRIMPYDHVNSTT